MIEKAATCADKDLRFHAKTFELKCLPMFKSSKFDKSLMHTEVDRLV